MNSSTTMKAVILVGGEGTRLRPLTYTTVKAMVPILNKPFIEHVINYLRSHGIGEVILAMGYKPDVIREYFDKHPMSARLIYSVEEAPLGTAGAVKYAEQYISDTFFVFNGDVFCDIDLTAMLRFHRSNKSVATIALTPVDDPSQFGVIEMDTNQRVKQFIEKPKREEAPSNMINAGVYILEPQIFDRIPPGERCMFEHNVFPGLIADNKAVFGYAADTAYWIDTGTPQKYMQLNRDLLSGKSSQICSRHGEIITGKDTIIHRGARLVPPVLVDQKCIVARDAQIIGPTILGRDCKVGEGAIVESSILWENVEIGRGAIVKNSILGNNNIVPDNRIIDSQVIGSDNRPSV